MEKEAVKWLLVHPFQLPDWLIQQSEELHQELLFQELSTQLEESHQEAELLFQELSIQLEVLYLELLQEMLLDSELETLDQLEHQAPELESRQLLTVEIQQDLELVSAKAINSVTSRPVETEMVLSTPDYLSVDSNLLDSRAPDSRTLVSWTVDSRILDSKILVSWTVDSRILDSKTLVSWTVGFRILDSKTLVSWTVDSRILDFLTLDSQDS